MTRRPGPIGELLHARGPNGERTIDEHGRAGHLSLADVIPLFCRGAAAPGLVEELRARGEARALAAREAGENAWNALAGRSGLDRERRDAEVERAREHWVQTPTGPRRRTLAEIEQDEDNTDEAQPSTPPPAALAAPPISPAAPAQPRLVAAHQETEMPTPLRSRMAAPTTVTAAPDQEARLEAAFALLARQPGRELARLSASERGAAPIIDEARLRRLRSTGKTIEQYVAMVERAAGIR